LENFAVNNNDPSAIAGWNRFWFAPIPTTGFTVLRVMSGLLFAFWLLSFLGHQDGFFSLNGWIDLQTLNAIQKHQLAMENQQETLTTPIGWSLLFAVGQDSALLHATYWSAIAVFVLFAFGVATRLTSVLSWVLVVSFLAGPGITYEGDYLLAILAFYLMVGHLFLHQWSDISTVERILGTWDQFLLQRWIFGHVSNEPRTSVAANWTLRLLQIHFVILMVMSGLHKLQMGDWWSGAALWYPLHPPLQTTIESLQREKASAHSTMFFVSLIGYLLIAWQIALPVFAWRTGIASRVILFGGAALGWVGLAYYFALPLFGPFICISCLSFLNPDEWSWIRARAQSVIGARAVHAPVRAAKQSAVLAGNPASVKK
jgi:hypothetical protein